MTLEELPMKIQLNPNNPRFIKDDKFKKLCKSIKDDPEFLTARPIVVKDGIIYGGNMRFRALQELGMEIKDEWVKDVSNWTDEQIRKFIVVDNLAYGDNDWDILSEQYEKEELENWGMDIDKWKEDDVVEDEVPEVTDNPVSKLGEVYQLGRHRIMCGDSTVKSDVEKLMDGKKADMVFTDPPYGISVVKNDMVGADFGVAKKGKYSPVVSDDTTQTAQDAYNTYVALGVPKIILWGGNYFLDFLPVSDGWLIWDKRGDSGIKNTFADGEMAWCNFHTPVRIYTQLWNGMIREGEHDKRVHPTQKPTKTISQIIKDFSDDNDTILDTFLGSGSTLIACEQTNRICYGMEIDEKYCDVIRKRYAKFIGKEEEWEKITPALK